MEERQRDSKGKFVYTTGGGRYKRINVNGKNLQYHRYIWELHFGKIPSGSVIHHINMNKKDNRLENLMLVDITTHNQIHKHAAWNKGKKCANISQSKMGHKVSKEQIEKSKKTWKDKFIPSMKKIYDLKKQNKSWEEISSALNLTIDSTKYRYFKYKKDYL